MVNPAFIFRGEYASEPTDCPAVRSPRICQLRDHIKAQANCGKATQCAGNRDAGEERSHIVAPQQRRCDKQRGSEDSQHQSIDDPLDSTVLDVYVERAFTSSIDNVRHVSGQRFKQPTPIPLRSCQFPQDVMGRKPSLDGLDLIRRNQFGDAEIGRKLLRRFPRASPAS